MPSIVNATTTAGVAVSGDNSGVLALQTNNGTTAVTIDTSQNVGIGTSGPGYALDVRSTAAPAIRLSRSGTAGQIASMVFEDGNATLGSGSTTRIASDAGAMSFSTGGTSGAVTGGTERMRVTSTGNVGIGTSSPASLLDITGNDPTIRLTDNAGSPASTWSMRSTDGNFAIRDVTNSFDRATFNANGCMALTGANLTATGIGITFPATQSASSDANTLDDYEEGTFTPVYIAVSGSITTYTTQLGRYTKIGDTVFFEVQLSVSNIGTISGQMRVGGLPFTPSSAVAVNYSIFIGRKSSFTNGPMGGAIFGGTTNLELYKFGSSANNTTDLQGSDLANNCLIYFSGFYQV
jgi:hypothetical protein